VGGGGGGGGATHPPTQSQPAPGPRSPPSLQQTLQLYPQAYSPAESTTLHGKSYSRPHTTWPRVGGKPHTHTQERRPRSHSCRLPWRGELGGRGGSWHHREAHPPRHRSPLWLPLACLPPWPAMPPHTRWPQRRTQRPHPTEEVVPRATLLQTEIHSGPLPVWRTASAVTRWAYILIYRRDGAPAASLCRWAGEHLAGECRRGLVLPACRTCHDAADPQWRDRRRAKRCTAHIPVSHLAELNVSLPAGPPNVCQRTGGQANMLRQISVAQWRDSAAAAPRAGAGASGSGSGSAELAAHSRHRADSSPPALCCARAFLTYV
jgi:hypothetical protein